MGDRATEVALFRYALIRQAADLALTKAERGRLVRDLAERPHVGPDGLEVRVGRSTADAWILGEWVLGEACRQAQLWHQTPELAHLTVAVNLSARQAAQPDLATVVANILIQTGLEPDCLVLEITESVLMHDTAHSLEMLASLKALGVRLSIDDFGTGYSSLSYLKRFPVDILKIDKSFVDGLGTDGSDAAIVAATITLAHSLGLATVAEGTETALQVRTLTDLGCDSAQGYFFARPQAAPGLTQTLMASRLPLHPR